MTKKVQKTETQEFLLGVNNNCKIKYLHLSCSILGLDALSKMNCLFSFVHKACPLLEVFDLIGPILGQQGAFDLDFQHLDHLKFIDICVWPCKYYTFKHTHEKMWKNINHPFTEKDLNDDFENEYKSIRHINLAWNHNNKKIAP
jgi:hypothetical protein